MRKSKNLVAAGHPKERDKGRGGTIQAPVADARGASPNGNGSTTGSGNTVDRGASFAGASTSSSMTTGNADAGQTGVKQIEGNRIPGENGHTQETAVDQRGEASELLTIRRPN